MVEGLLWYDDNPGRDLAEKVGRAARRYRQKFGEEPNVCLVHPSALKSETQIGGVRVSSQPSVLRHHFWVGRGEKRPHAWTQSEKKHTFNKEGEKQNG